MTIFEKIRPIRIKLRKIEKSGIKANVPGLGIQLVLLQEIIYKCPLGRNYEDGEKISAEDSKYLRMLIEKARFINLILEAYIKDI
jgi:hypothetical protein